MTERNRNAIGRKADSDPASVTEKIRRYCSYHERSEKEAELKLKSLKAPASKTKAILNQLREEGFLNEERFARAYVRGKWKVNRWGKIRIRYELKAKGISEKLISSALLEIDEDIYRDMLETIIRKKSGEFRHKGEEKNISKKSLNIRDKIFNFALGKGYETDLVNEILNELKI
jgi:regulatory protein